MRGVESLRIDGVHPASVLTVFITGLVGVAHSVAEIGNIAGFICGWDTRFVRFVGRSLRRLGGFGWGLG